MQVNDALIDKLSSLSKLQFEGAARAQIAADLTRMLDFVAQINAVDTTGVLPLIHLTHEINRLREDEPQQQITQAEALANAPRKDSDYIRVPKVLDKQ